MAGDLVELIERVRLATSGDRSIDESIAESVLGFTKTNRMAKWPHEEPIWEFSDPAQNCYGSDDVMVRPYTSSLDAIVALIEAKLPGCGWWVARGVKDGVPAVGASIYATLAASEPIAKEAGETPPVALCLAFLLALSSTQKDAS